MTISEIKDEIRRRFEEARAKAGSNEDGFARGYADALGEMLEYMTDGAWPHEPR